MALWIPVIRPKDKKTSRDWLLLPLTLPCTFAFCFLLGIYAIAGGWIIVPVFLIKGMREKKAGRRWERQLKEQGRLLTWPEVETRLSQAEGSLIVQWGENWWTDRKPAQVPLPLIHFEEQGTHIVHPAVRANFLERYLDPHHGSASFVLPEEPDNELAPWRSHFPVAEIKQRFPRASIIVVLDERGVSDPA